MWHDHWFGLMRMWECSCSNERVRCVFCAVKFMRCCTEKSILIITLALDYRIMTCKAQALWIAYTLSSVKFLVKETNSFHYKTIHYFDKGGFADLPRFLKLVFLFILCLFLVAWRVHAAATASFFLSRSRSLGLAGARACRPWWLLLLPRSLSSRRWHAASLISQRHHPNDSGLQPTC